VNVGRGVEQEPPLAVGAHRGGGLAPGQGPGWVGTDDAAGVAPAVPLGKTTAGGAAKEDDVHAGEKKRRRSPWWSPAVRRSYFLPA
jgi:hypothetical protein